MALPAWASRLVDLYESGAYNQFLVFGNIQDRLTIPGNPARLSSLTEFLMAVLLPRFDVVLSYDLGNGIRVEKGGEIFASWPALKERALAKQPLAAVSRSRNIFAIVEIWRGCKGRRSKSRVSSKTLSSSRPQREAPPITNLEQCSP